MDDKPLSVLLVEDDAIYARLIIALLARQQSLPCRVTHVERLAQANEAAERELCRLALLDLSLPDSRVDETLPAYLECASNIPVIVLTGRDDQTFGLKAVQLGAQDYLVKKDVTADMLVRAMRYALERFRLQQELRSLSLTDPLCCILNRRGFVTLAEQEIKVARARSTPVTMVFADVDRFKIINDTLGHRAGDEVLFRIAAALREVTRPSDIVARIGGDEFVALLIDAGTAAAGPIVDALRQRLGTAAALKELPCLVEVSTGFAEWDSSSTESLDQLMSRADRALYEAKHAARQVSGSKPSG